MKNSTVILISIDCLRADRITPEIMPFLSRFAQETLNFTQCYAQSSYSLASHGSILTGLYPSVHGASIPQQQGLYNVPTLTTHLHRAGFSTAAWTGGPHLNPLWRLNKDFQKYERCPYLNKNLEDAVQYLKRHQRQPNFVFIHGLDLHAAHLTAGTRAQQFTHLVSQQENILQELKVSPTRHVKDKKTQQFLQALYDDSAAAVDQLLAQFVDRVQQLDEWNNTLLIITAPHGETLGGHSTFFRHGHILTNDLLHIPLLMRAPELPARTISTQVRSTDIMPTVLQYLDLPVPHVQGASLLPLATREGVDRILFSELNYPSRNIYALQRGMKKSVIYDRESIVVRSDDFNLIKNPHELTKKRSRLVRTLRRVFRRNASPSQEVTEVINKNKKISQSLQRTHFGPSVVRQLAKVEK
jgi:arylsulfatase A-like enzyme